MITERSQRGRVDHVLDLREARIIDPAAHTGKVAADDLLGLQALQLLLRNAMQTQVIGQTGAPLGAVGGTHQE